MADCPQTASPASAARPAHESEYNHMTMEHLPSRTCQVCTQEIESGAYPALASVLSNEAPPCQPPMCTLCAIYAHSMPDGTCSMCMVCGGCLHDEESSPEEEDSGAPQPTIASNYADEDNASLCPYDMEGYEEVSETYDEAGMKDSDSTDEGHYVQMRTDEEEARVRQANLDFYEEWSVDSDGNMSPRDNASIPVLLSNEIEQESPCPYDCSDYEEISETYEETMESGDTDVGNPAL